MLPTPSDLMHMIPSQEEDCQFIEQSRQTIQNILDYKDPRLLLIVGPCSVHDLDATWEYALKLKQLATQVKSSIFIVMRVYFEKARSSLGWKGFLLDPDLNGSNEIEKGIYQARHFLKKLAALNLPCGCEFLDPLVSAYIQDFISWGCIGARTCASQIHRQLASSLPMPVAFKNSIEGNIEIAVQGMQVASSQHLCLGLDQNGKITSQKTRGNLYSHLVLRGGIEKSNYDLESINQALRSLGKCALPERLVIDCAHENSRKIPKQQQVVFHAILHQILEGNTNIRGLMLESFLEEGNQQLLPSAYLKYGLSVTDPCLDWEATEELVLWAHQNLSHCESKICEISM